MNALIIVDLQNDFLPGGALAVPQADQIIPLANRLTPRFELVLATRDWHPPNHGSFAAAHPGRKPGQVILLNGLEQTLWPVHCVQHTPGAEPPATLDTSRIARVFHKGTDPGVDSYSGFFDNGRRHATGLERYLRERGVREVYLLGLATDFCVRATALDAAALGFNTRVIQDGCRAVELSPGDGERALAQMRQAGIGVVRSDELALA